MRISAIEKAEILSKALPFIQKYHDKIIVVKYGGNAMKNEQLKENVIADVVLLAEIGIKVVLVHGGGPEINRMLDKVGIESTFINGLRYTDKETMNIVQMVLAGKTNKDLVGMLHRKGAKAVGICGMDGGLIRASKLKTEDDLGYVGSIDGINEEVLFDLLDKGYIPVVASVGVDAQGTVYNINADTAASSIAGKLNAENFLLVSDVPGVLEDPANDETLIPQIQIRNIEALMERGIISGGMIPKVNCCVNAIKHDVKKSVIIDGRVPHSILIEMLTEDGIGTMFEK